MRSPFGGDAVDGRRLLAEAVGFGRALRAAGLHIDLGAAVDYARALTLIDIGQQGDGPGGRCQAVFVRRRDDREVYDRVFDRWWRQRRRKQPNDGPATMTSDDVVPPETGQRGRRRPSPDDERRGDEGSVDGIPMPMSGGDEWSTRRTSTATSPPRRVLVAAEALRHRDFDRMTPAELRDAERLVDLLEPRLELRRTRRYELHHHGRLLAPRAMFRRNLGTGGQFTDWVWRRPIRSGRARSSSCATSRARWSATRGCCCGSSRRCRRRRR